MRSALLTLPLLPKRGEACIHCQKKFQPSQEYISLLQAKEENEWLRQDLCLECEVSMEKKTRLENAVTWKGKVPPKISRPIPQEEKALSLLREWGIHPVPEKKYTLFALILFLDRRKAVSRRPEIKTTPGISHYEVLATGELFAIEVCKLQGLEGQQALEELKQCLEG